MSAPTRSPHSRPQQEEVSKMNMICRWVHADDGALVMEWTTAEGTAVHVGTDANEVAYAFEVFDDNADALTPVGV
jgi:Ca2+-binding EF-hand superfamily protein